VIRNSCGELSCGESRAAAHGLIGYGDCRSASHQLEFQVLLGSIDWQVNGAGSV